MRHLRHVGTSCVSAAPAPAARAITLTTAVVLFVPLALCACASAGSGTPRPSYEQRALAPVGRQSSSDHVVPQDLAALTDLNLEDALRRIRPEWMRPIPTMRQVAEPGVASVYLNDAYAGGLDALRLIPIEAVISARYLTPTAARSWFGMFCQCAGGVILVSTRTEN